MMDRRKTKVAICGVVLMTLFLLPSCHDKIELPDGADSNEIALVISEGEPYTPSTKSPEGEIQAKPASLLLVESEEMGEIYLSVAESSIHTGLADTVTIQTKGVPYDQNNNVPNFNLTSYVFPNTANSYFSETFNNDGSNPVSTGYYWPPVNGTLYMSFFGHFTPSAGGLTPPNHILKAGTTNYSAHSGTFSYTLPDPNTTENEDAVSQSDLVFAITANQTPPEGGASVNLKFYHALSSIVFTVGTVPAQFKVGKITIENVYPSGNCTYTHQSGNAISFDWDLTGSAESDYTQTFDQEVGSATTEAGSPINEPSQTFMMIPQTINGNANLKIVFYFGDREYTITKKLSGLTSEWEPGKKYTYRISANEEVDIELEDEVSSDKHTKSNMIITNNGIGTVYIRAMLQGEWYTTNDNGEQLVVAQWNKDTDGTFTGFNTTDWLYSSKDGYYYYKYPLAKGATANKLFETYVLNTVPPVLDAELNLYVATQAVVESKVESVWGEIVTKNSSTGELILK